MTAGRMRSAPLLLPMLLGVALTGCGGSGSSEPAVVPAALPVKQLQSRPAPILAKKKLVKKAERLCRRSSDQRFLAHAPALDAASPEASVQRAREFARAYVVTAKRGYRRFHALGIPRRGLARRRWIGFLSQYRATINHLDELQAGVKVSDTTYAEQSLRRLKKAANSAVRRGQKLGLHSCIS
jgi:hypothetical protein